MIYATSLSYVLFCCQIRHGNDGRSSSSSRSKCGCECHCLPCIPSLAAFISFNFNWMTRKVFTVTPFARVSSEIVTNDDEINPTILWLKISVKLYSTVLEHLSFFPNDPPTLMNMNRFERVNSRGNGWIGRKIYIFKNHFRNRYASTNLQNQFV